MAFKKLQIIFKEFYRKDYNLFNQTRSLHEF